MFPDNESFRNAYLTAQPLLSKVAFAVDESMQDDGDGTCQNPTAEHSDESSIIPTTILYNCTDKSDDLKNVRLRAISNLFHMQDLDQVFTRHFETLGQEQTTALKYKLVRKALRKTKQKQALELDGTFGDDDDDDEHHLKEESTATLAPERVDTMAKALEAHQRYGFTLVIDGLEQHWDAVKQWTRQLQRETQQSLVSCNLYLTPPPHQSGFEAHWDWMDVMVVQVHGSKVWRVAQTATVPMCNQKLKRPPSRQELHQETWYNDFVLHAGDVLYIPRGFLHNATSMGTNSGDESAAGQPSLHLTFGIESTDTTLATLIEHGIQDCMPEFIPVMKDLEDMPHDQVGILLRQSIWPLLRSVEGQYRRGIEAIVAAITSTTRYATTIDDAEKFRNFALNNYESALERFQQKIRDPAR